MYLYHHPQSTYTGLFCLAIKNHNIETRDANILEFIEIFGNILEIWLQEETQNFKNLKLDYLNNKRQSPFVFVFLQTAFLEIVTSYDIDLLAVRDS